jgi:DNA topoisomerase-1
MNYNEYELENEEIFEIETKREFGNEKGKLVIQPLGIIVIEFLEQYFSELFNYNYTKDMEECLDKIAKGSLLWYEICKECNTQVDSIINALSDKGLDSKLEIKLDEQNTYLVGKYGPVVKHTEEIDGKELVTFQSVKTDIDIDQLKKGDFVVEDIVDAEKNKNKSASSIILGQHEGNDVVLRKGKFGLYISWGKNSKTLKELGNRPIENITYEDIRKYLEEGSNVIREISANMSIRRGQKGDYLFYKTSKMKKPQFYDIKGFENDNKNENYKLCNINILKSWIKEKYDI